MLFIVFIQKLLELNLDGNSFSLHKYLKYSISVGAAISVAYLAEIKFNVTGFPPVYLSAVAMIFAMCLNSYALIKNAFFDPSKSASTCGEFLIYAI